MQERNVKSCEILLKEFNESDKSSRNPERLIFEGVTGHDIYNITAPFMVNGDIVLAGRVEPRDSEHSTVHFFTHDHGKWIKKDHPQLTLQDPFFTCIQGELIVGGVEIFPHPIHEGQLSWRTVFYKGSDLSSLTPFFRGPNGMKDLRLVELMDGSVGVFTRPQGEKGGRGKIGYTRVSSLTELSIQLINDAPLLDGQFTEGEWGGANELHVLSNGLIGVLGHIASFDDEGNRHYYPMVFSFNPETHEHSPIELIATRSQFLEGPTKRPDLVDVVFSGGIVRNSNGTAELYAGISDADAQKITIDDPFALYEK